MNGKKRNDAPDMKEKYGFVNLQNSIQNTKSVKMLHYIVGELATTHDPPIPAI